jgi:hypothetical protein
MEGYGATEGILVQWELKHGNREHELTAAPGKCRAGHIARALQEKDTPLLKLL